MKNWRVSDDENLSSEKKLKKKKYSATRSLSKDKIRIDIKTNDDMTYSQLQNSNKNGINMKLQKFNKSSGYKFQGSLKKNEINVKKSLEETVIKQKPYGHKVDRKRKYLPKLPHESKTNFNMKINSLKSEITTIDEISNKKSVTTSDLMTKQYLADRNILDQALLLRSKNNSSFNSTNKYKFERFGSCSRTEKNTYKIVESTKDCELAVINDFILSLALDYFELQARFFHINLTQNEDNSCLESGNKENQDEQELKIITCSGIPHQKLIKYLWAKAFIFAVKSRTGLKKAIVSDTVIRAKLIINEFISQYPDSDDNIEDFQEIGQIITNEYKSEKTFSKLNKAKYKKSVWLQINDISTPCYIRMVPLPTTKCSIISAMKALSDSSTQKKQFISDLYSFLGLLDNITNIENSSTIFCHELVRRNMLKGNTTYKMDGVSINSISEDILELSLHKEGLSFLTDILPSIIVSCYEHQHIAILMKESNSYFKLDSKKLGDITCTRDITENNSSNNELYFIGNKKYFPAKDISLHMFFDLRIKKNIFTLCLNTIKLAVLSTCSYIQSDFFKTYIVEQYNNAPELVEYLNKKKIFIFRNSDLLNISIEEHIKSVFLSIPNITFALSELNKKSPHLLDLVLLNTELQRYFLNNPCSIILLSLSPTVISFSIQRTNVLDHFKSNYITSLFIEYYSSAKILLSSTSFLNRLFHELPEDINPLIWEILLQNEEYLHILKTDGSFLSNLLEDFLTKKTYDKSKYNKKPRQPLYILSAEYNSTKTLNNYLAYTIFIYDCLNKKLLNIDIRVLKHYDMLQIFDLEKTIQILKNKYKLELDYLLKILDEPVNGIVSKRMITYSNPEKKSIKLKNSMGSKNLSNRELVIKTSDDNIQNIELTSNSSNLNNYEHESIIQIEQDISTSVKTNPLDNILSKKIKCNNTIIIDENTNTENNISSLENNSANIEKPSSLQTDIIHKQLDERNSLVLDTQTLVSKRCYQDYSDKSKDSYSKFHDIQQEAVMKEIGNITANDNINYITLENVFTLNKSDKNKFQNKTKSILSMKNELENQNTLSNNIYTKSDEMTICKKLPNGLNQYFNISEKSIVEEVYPLVQKSDYSRFKNDIKSGLRYNAIQKSKLQVDNARQNWGFNTLSVLESQKKVIQETLQSMNKEKHVLVTRGLELKNKIKLTKLYLQYLKQISCDVKKKNDELSEIYIINQNKILELNANSKDFHKVYQIIYSSNNIEKYLAGSYLTKFQSIDYSFDSKLSLNGNLKEIILESENKHYCKSVETCYKTVPEKNSRSQENEVFNIYNDLNKYILKRSSSENKCFYQYKPKNLNILKRSSSTNQLLLSYHRLDYFEKNRYTKNFENIFSINNSPIKENKYNISNSNNHFSKIFFSSLSGYKYYNEKKKNYILDRSVTEELSYNFGNILSYLNNYRADLEPLFLVIPISIQTIINENRKYIFTDNTFDSMILKLRMTTNMKNLPKADLLGFELLNCKEHNMLIAKILKMLHVYINLLITCSEHLHDLNIATNIDKDFFAHAGLSDEECFSKFITNIETIGNVLFDYNNDVFFQT